MPLPWNLQDVVDRMKSGQRVYGFELELLADHVSRHGDGGSAF